MLFKISKLKINLSRTAAFFVITLLGYFSVIGQSMAGGDFFDQGNAVYRGMIQELIKQKICTDNLSCSRKIQLYRRDGKRIYFNMYGQTDMALTATVSKFLIEKGLELSNGMPITLTVYLKQKKEYINSISFFSKDDESLKLELNK